MAVDHARHERAVADMHAGRGGGADRLVGDVFYGAVLDQDLHPVDGFITTGIQETSAGEEDALLMRSALS